MGRETLEDILDRRSVRQFSEEPVSDADLEQLLEVGFYAPSGLSRFPVHFIVIRDEDTRREMCGYLKWARALQTAPVAIAVCGDQGKSPIVWVDDCAASIMNILLAAQGMGLGACWCSIYDAPDDEKKTAELLRLPEHLRVSAIVAIGHPLRKKERPQRVDRSRIHWEHWTASE